MLGPPWRFPGLSHGRAVSRTPPAPSSRSIPAASARSLYQATQPPSTICLPVKVKCGRECGLRRVRRDNLKRASLRCGRQADRCSPGGWWARTYRWRQRPGSSQRLEGVSHEHGWLIFRRGVEHIDLISDRKITAPHHQGPTPISPAMKRLALSRKASRTSTGSCSHTQVRRIPSGQRSGCVLTYSCSAKSSVTGCPLSGMRWYRESIPQG